MKRIGQLLVWCLVCLSVTQVMAQSGDCPTIVQSALSATDQYCASTGRNQACYGNLNLQAVPQAGVSAFSFSKPGDLVNVGDVQSLTLSPLDSQGNTWGVALMKVQANIPDTLPGQNVTFLLFGNVEIDNAVTPAAGGVPASGSQTGSTAPSGATLPVTVSSPAPLMASLTATTPPKMLNAGTTATADGRDPSGQMLHITLADGTSGWTMAAMVKVQGDVNSLPTVSLTGGAVPGLPAAAPTKAPAPQETPMRAFYFKTGANDAPCSQAPSSGILVQTPEGVGKISLTMNGVDVQLGSTAYIQAAANDSSQTQLTVNVVEGQGIVSAQGVTKVVPAGTRVQVPLQTDSNNHLVASGAPGNVEPYDNAALAALPVGHLPRQVTVAPALTADQIAALASTPISIVGGSWTSSYGDMVAGAGCDADTAMGLAFANGIARGTTVQLPSGAFDLQTAMAASGSQLPPGAKITTISANEFTMDFSESGTTVSFDMQVTSPTHIDMNINMTLEDGCHITFPGTMDAKAQ